MDTSTGGQCVVRMIYISELVVRKPFKVKQYSGVGYQGKANCWSDSHKVVNRARYLFGTRTEY